MEEQLKELFGQRSLKDILTIKSFSVSHLMLTDDEIMSLIELNVVFLASPGPSAAIRLDNIHANGRITVVHFERNMILKLSTEEVIAIILHEIWHALNPDRRGIEAEYEADNFAFEKGYGRWIVKGLQNGLRNKWLGFDPKECGLRIQRLQEILGDEDEDDEEMENDISLDDLEKIDLDKEDDQLI
jgi:hypothetical protein